MRLTTLLPPARAHTPTVTPTHGSTVMVAWPLAPWGNWPSPQVVFARGSHAELVIDPATPGVKIAEPVLTDANVTLVGEDETVPTDAVSWRAPAPV